MPICTTLSSQKLNTYGGRIKDFIFLFIVLCIFQIFWKEVLEIEIKIKN